MSTFWILFPENVLDHGPAFWILFPVGKILEIFILVALPTIKNTNTKSFTDLQISRQTNSSGILSDQNLSGGASGNRLQNQTENHYEVIDDIIRRNVIHQDDSSDSGTYLSFTEEVRLRKGYPKLILLPLYRDLLKT